MDGGTLCGVSRWACVPRPHAQCTRSPTPAACATRSQSAARSCTYIPQGQSVVDLLEAHMDTLGEEGAPLLRLLGCWLR